MVEKPSAGMSKMNEHSVLMECYTISGAKKIGMQAMYDSALVQDGYVGRMAEEPLLEEEIRILRGRMPGGQALFDILNEATEKGAEWNLDEWKARKEMLGKKGNWGRARRKEARSKSDGGDAGGVAARTVAQAELTAPPTVEEEEVGQIASVNDQHLQVQAHNAIDVTKQGRPPKTRGRRQRGEEISEVIMINSSGLPQLLDTVDVAAKRGGKVVAILHQEQQRGILQVADMQSRLRNMRWRTAVAPATTGEWGGNSASVAIVTPLHVGCGR